MVPESGWMDRIVNIRDELTRKHGTQERKKSVIPKQCQKEAEFVKCLKEATAIVEYVWKWPSGDKIVLAAGRRKGADSEAVIILKYERGGSGN
jgi:hypothetical protein